MTLDVELISTIARALNQTIFELQRADPRTVTVLHVVAAFRALRNGAIDLGGTDESSVRYAEEFADHLKLIREAPH